MEKKNLVNNNAKVIKESKYLRGWKLCLGQFAGPGIDRVIDGMWEIGFSQIGVMEDAPL